MMRSSKWEKGIERGRKGWEEEECILDLKDKLADRERES
jgi:hypothetical protein